jgi:transcriptional regulator with XRE-family HTH domain
MTKDDYSKWRNANGFTHEDAAAFLGCCRRTSVNYQNGTSKIPPSVDKLIALDNRAKAVGLT